MRCWEEQPIPHFSQPTSTTVISGSQTVGQHTHTHTVYKYNLLSLLPRSPEGPSKTLTLLHAVSRYSLLGYDAVLLDNSFPTFRGNVGVPFPRDTATLVEQTTTSPLNVGSQVPSDAAAHPKERLSQ